MVEILFIITDKRTLRLHFIVIPVKTPSFVALLLLALKLKILLKRLLSVWISFFSFCKIKIKYFDSVFKSMELLTAQVVHPPQETAPKISHVLLQFFNKRQLFSSLVKRSLIFIRSYLTIQRDRESYVHEDNDHGSAYIDLHHQNSYLGANKELCPCMRTMIKAQHIYLYHQDTNLTVNKIQLSSWEIEHHRY